MFYGSSKGAALLAVPVPVPVRVHVPVPVCVLALFSKMQLTVKLANLATLSGRVRTSCNTFP